MDALPTDGPAGWVDLHCHGGGGVDFAAGTADDVARAEGVHAAHGTTALLASLVSLPLPDLLARVELLAGRAEAGTGLIRGIHLEGPFLAPGRRGAHDPAALLRPDLGALAELLATGRGTVRVITVAPELPGAAELVEAAVAAGVLVAVGHTDATYDEAAAAFARGARLVTHLFNAMPPLLHRAPGPVQAALDAPEVVCELIADGVHVHPAVLRHAAHDLPGRFVLVTDASAGAGAPPGRYRLGTQRIDVAHERGGDGATTARLADGTLAGSTLTMDRAVAVAVAAGIDPALARAAASTTPAALLAPRG